MSRIGRGDQQAFAVLVKRYIDALYNYAFRLSGKAALADDLVQETWLAAWQHAMGFNPRKAKLTTWLHRILHNKFIDAARKNRLHLDESAVAAAVGDYNAEYIATQNQQSVLLDELINELPEREKAAIVLTYSQGFANRDVAQILGLSVRATESLLARAKQTLRTAYNHRTANTVVLRNVNGAETTSKIDYE